MSLLEDLFPLPSDLVVRDLRELALDSENKPVKVLSLGGSQRSLHNIVSELVLD